MKSPLASAILLVGAVALFVSGAIVARGSPASHADTVTVSHHSAAATPR